jgi:hypothetical protein
MAPLPDKRRERFAQLLAQGRKQGEAYALAGFQESDANASRLAKNAAIRARVDELRAAVRTRFATSDGTSRQTSRTSPDKPAGRDEDQSITRQAIAEIVTEQEVVVSLESLLRDLQQAQDMAYALKKPAVIVQVVQAKAVLAGLTFKPEARPRQSGDPFKDVSDERLREILDAIDAIKEIEGSPEPKPERATNVAKNATNVADPPPKPAPPPQRLEPNDPRLVEPALRKPDPPPAPPPIERPSRPPRRVLQ